MKTRILEKSAFTVGGRSLSRKTSDDFPGLWTSLMDELPEETIMRLGSGQSYGVCLDYTEDGYLTYMAAFDVLDRDLARQLDLEVLEVGAARYLVLEIQGSVPGSIHAGWDWLMNEYFPESELTHAGTPDFEFYLPGDMTSPDYKMELWVPVIEKRPVD